MKRVLVTGASGFIGKQCVRYLCEQGHEVHGVFRAEHTGLHPDLRIHRADLLDAFACERVIEAVLPTHILHLAWITQPALYWTSLENYDWLRSSMYLAEAFFRNGGERFVGSGSCAEYGAPDGGFCRETSTAILPKTIYGRAKASLAYSLEGLAWQYGRSWAWPRIFFAYGPGEPPWKLISNVVSSLANGVVPSLRAPNRLVDFIYIDDVAAALVALVDADVSGPFNVASGKPMRIRDSVAEIVRTYYPHLLSEFEQNVPFAESGEPGIYADVRRIVDGTTFHPSVSLVKGVGHMIAAAAQNVTI